MLLNCLKASHAKDKCSSPFHCRIPACKDLHHSTLHNAITQERAPIKIEDNQKEGNRTETEETKVGFTRAGKRRVLLQVVPVKVTSASGKEELTYAILDDCSQATLIRDDFVEKLGIKGTQVDVSIGTITQDGEDLSVNQIEFKITAATFKGKTFTVSSAYSIPKSKFRVPSQKLPLDFSTNSKYQHLQDSRQSLSC